MLNSLSPERPPHWALSQGCVTQAQPPDPQPLSPENSRQRPGSAERCSGGTQRAGGRSGRPVSGDSGQRPRTGGAGHASLRVELPATKAPSRGHAWWCFWSHRSKWRGRRWGCGGGGQDPAGGDVVRPLPFIPGDRSAEGRGLGVMADLFLDGSLRLRVERDSGYL